MKKLRTIVVAAALVSSWAGSASASCWNCRYWPFPDCVTSGFFTGYNGCTAWYGTDPYCIAAGDICAPLATHDALSGFGWVVAAVDGASNETTLPGLGSYVAAGVAVRRRSCDRSVIGAEFSMSAVIKFQRTTRTINL